MVILTFFAFLAGVVTILSPCILPILPIILSGSLGGVQNNKKPLGVIVGFILSFTFFTLLLSSLVKYFGISAEFLRNLSIFVIVLFGVSFLIPRFQLELEKLFSKLSNKLPNLSGKQGFGGGVILGLSLGLLWSPCVGPILASVISLAVSGTVTLQAFWIIFAYSVGTALPMFLIMLGGRNLLNKVPALNQNLGKIQKAFGVIMIFVGLSIYFNLDRSFQTYILNTFPKYGTGLTKFESNDKVLNQLDKNLAYDQEETQEVQLDQSGLPKIALAPEIILGGQWFNSEPTKLTDLRGKVVLIDFWTYTCVNCQRTIPYINKWWKEYKNKGLVIIGVHSPEFEFEKSPENVSRALLDFGISYPVMQDNNFATWRSYNNRYWPAKYLIDKDGYIRYYHFGEGSYAETEKAIQQLLFEVDSSTSMADPEKEPINMVLQNFAKTPEVYLGHFRQSVLASPESVVKDSYTKYTSPKKLPENAFGLEGDWLIGGEAIEPKKGSVLYLNFDASKVFLVIKPKNGKPSSVKVTLDGKTEFLGEDALNGALNVDTARLYKMVDLKKPGRHILRIEFFDENAELYAFTFG